MKSSLIRRFRLRGRIVQFLCGLLLMVAGVGIFEQNPWKGSFVFVGSLPIFFTAMCILSIEVREDYTKIRTPIFLIKIRSKAIYNFEHKYFYGRWVGLFVGTNGYPFWAWFFFPAITPHWKGVVLHPFFLVEDKEINSSK